MGEKISNGLRFLFFSWFKYSYGKLDCPL